MRTIIVLRGLPGSGKSTYAAQLIRLEPGRWMRINRDELRAMVTCHVEPTHNEDRERLLRTVKLDVARLALAAGFDVILDDTHLVPATVAHIHAFAAELGAVRVIEKAFNLPVHECFARNARRPRATRVPKKAILRMVRAAALDASDQLHDREAYYPSAADPGAPPEGEER